ncbi:MAG: Gfo/Idh/MocA family oxidoreductase [Pseudomonadales bacterium]|nr:Gfo/Idh/MocA family oxidoreductase [Pseudomonadales bacterium]
MLNKKIAIVGFGAHVKKNILPILERMGVHVKSVVVRVPHPSHLLFNFDFTTNFSDVLNDDEIEFIYVATPISTHYEIVKLGLESNKNILCEKPLTFDVDKAKELFDLAKESNCILKEVMMYKYHTQFFTLNELVKSNEFGRMISINAKFMIPHLEYNNIRYDLEKNGGALLDVGYYPISGIQSLLSNYKLDYSIIKGGLGYEVDLNGIAVFSNEDVYAIAQWAIGSAYKNEIVIEFEKARIVVERAFSKPETFQSNIKIYFSNGDEKKLVINPCSHFEQEFKLFLNGKVNKNHNNEVINRIAIFNSILKY